MPSQGGQELIRYVIKAEGQDETKRAFDTVTKGLTENTKAANDNAAAHRELKESANELTEGMHHTGRGVAALSAAFNGLAPGLTEGAHAFHEAATSALYLGQALGGGVAGLAVGGLVAAISLYTEHQKEAKEAAAKFKEQLEEQKKAAEAAALALDALIRRYDHVAGDLDPAKAKDIAALGASTYQRGISYDEMRRRNNALERAKEEAFGAARTEANAADLAKINAADEQLKSLGYKSTSESEGKGPEFNKNNIAAEATATRMQEQINAIHRQTEAVQNASKIEMQIQQAQTAHAKRLIDDEARSNTKKFHDEVQAAKDADQQMAKLEERQKKGHEALRKVGTDAYQQMGSIGIGALQALAKGQKVTAAAILGSIGDAMVASGERYLFEGLALQFLPGGQGNGGALIGIGTAEIAAGIALGAATRPSGGGGAGAGASANRPASPISGGSDNMPPATYNVHVSMPTVVSPTAQDGQRVTRALREFKNAGLPP